MNSMCVEFSAISQNEAFARICVSAFLLPLDPKVSDLTDIKTAVSEAVTNSIIHGYEGSEGTVKLECCIRGRQVEITVSDKGIGIEDLEKAKKPLYTSKPLEERSGMGFTVMEAFMDKVDVSSQPGSGTVVTMLKDL